MGFSAVVTLAFLALGGLFALGRRENRSQEDFAVAGRRLSGAALLATLAASNLSAFTVFGVSGAAYRTGWAFFPVMAFGTAFMALSFAYIGVPLRRLSAERGWLTPGDFIAGRFGSRAAGFVFSTLSLAYTLPYLSAQAASGGRLIAAATGLPAALASALLVATVTLYVFRGGMRAVVRTDALQLAALVGLGLAAAVVVARAYAGAGSPGWFAAADAGAMARAGADGSLPLAALAGYYLLWSLADPMFPHFTQRFFSARGDRALLSSMVAYPFVLLLVFLPMSAIGVMGRALAPGLTGAAADGVFTLLVTRYAGPIVGPIFSVAALAALMSTMDSQLLSCSTMIVRDLGGGMAGRVRPWETKGDTEAPAGASVEARQARLMALAGAALGLVAWLSSLRPPEAMLSFLNRAAFPGYASLAPAALAALYLPGVGAGAAVASLLAGAALVAMQAAGVFTPPLPAVFFNLGVQALILAAGYAARWSRRGFAMRRAGVAPVAVGRRAVPWIVLFVALAFLGLDPWSFLTSTWSRPWLLGLPPWLWYQVALTASLGAAFAALARAIAGRADGSG
jgi:SSS family solute:Na+ symporter